MLHAKNRFDLIVGVDAMTNAAALLQIADLKPKFGGAVLTVNSQIGTMLGLELQRGLSGGPNGALEAAKPRPNTRPRADAPTATDRRAGGPADRRRRPARPAGRAGRCLSSSGCSRT